MLLKISLIIFLICYTQSQNCQAMSLTETCDFYPQCLETKYHCGPKGYPIGYGFKYCSKFINFFDNFPPKGQEWIKKTLVCLKQALLKDFNSCDQLYDTAFNSHPECYFKAGFCDLFLDPKHIKQTIQALLKVYELKDFASITSMKQIYDTAKLCGTDYMNKLKDIMNINLLD